MRADLPRPRLVLASASPARLKLLRDAGLAPDVVVSGIDEESVEAETVAALVAQLAVSKGDAVAGRLTADADTVVVACDSLLDLDGQALGKPADLDEARRRWAAMAGRSGVLRTGHCVLRIGDGEVLARRVEVASTVVHFGTPDPGELAAYLASGEPLAVAGAFTLDGRAAPFIEGITGDAGTVIGLSLPLLRRMLADVGIRITDLWV